MEGPGHGGREVKATSHLLSRTLALGPAPRPTRPSSCPSPEETGCQEPPAPGAAGGRGPRRAPGSPGGHGALRAHQPQHGECSRGQRALWAALTRQGSGFQGGGGCPQRPRPARPREPLDTAPCGRGLCRAPVSCLVWGAELSMNLRLGSHLGLGALGWGGA